MTDSKKNKPGKALKQKREEAEKPIVYKDGFGKIIPDEDVILREKLNEELIRKFSRRIEYEGNLRAGSVIYIDRDTRISFYNEMGGGNCLAYIIVPKEEEWEAQTNTPLARRKDILEYVASAVQAQQASNCYFEIKENEIGFYYK
ncbi:MAG TPA: hypothetical protein VN451_04275 [Chitinophagaceae bacterium]|nr:hypothetical protein [Chitinophagaceae bacterium]